MRYIHNKILKQIAFAGLSIQLILVLSGFIAYINPSDCCHIDKVEKNVHSCCDESSQQIPMKCESQQPINSQSFSNCGCIHTVGKNSSDYTVQKSFELQKESNLAFLFHSTELQKNSSSFHLKQRVEKEHSPPLFILDASLRI